MFGDQATDSAYSKIVFSSFVCSWPLLEALKFPIIVKKMPFLTSKPEDGLLLKH